MTGKGFLIFTGSNMRAIVAFCRRARELRAPFFIIARTIDDPIFHTAYRRDVVATRKEITLRLDDIERCLQIVDQEIGLEEYIICPTSEFFNLFLLEHRAFFSHYRCQIPLVDLLSYQCVSDKESFTNICINNGLAVPKKIENPEESGFPFVAKPRHNLGDDGRILYPYLIFNDTDWGKFLAHEGLDDFFYQEYVHGKSYYLLFYFSRSGDAVSFSQENLAQQVGGKSIVLAQTAHIHHLPVASHYIRLLKDLDFHGLAMVELKQAEYSADFIFIELNPRFWGPSQLFVDAQALLFDHFIFDYVTPVSSGLSTKDRTHIATYFWFNGLLDSWYNQNDLTWYGREPFSLIKCIIQNLRHEVYLRPDTYRYFFLEFMRIWKNKR